MEVRRSRLAFVSLLLVLAGCKHCGEEAPASRDAAPDAVVPTSTSTVDAGYDASVDAAAPPFDAAPLDAGASACRLVYGPAEQPFRGPAAIVPSPSLLELVANDSGKPRVYGVPIAAIPPPGAPPVTGPRPLSFTGVRWPACEIANRWAYCQGPGGTIQRTPLGGGDTTRVAKARNGTHLSAAPLGKDHAVVAWLEARPTSEGEMLQAFAAVDDGEATRLSDEGAGATMVRLVARGEGALAVYMDTRTAMIPLHARGVTLSAKGKTPAVGPDEVVFVGGPPERGVEFAIAEGAGATFALLPNAKESAEFGMAALAISDPPKHDVAAVWSLYPNGLDPAPIAATTDASDPKGPIVARVRPRERAPGSPRILELGRLDASGAFTSFGGIADGRRVTDIALARDRFGAVWILYGDTTITWLERRVCP